MMNNWTKVLLSTAAMATLLVSCKPKPDTDTPFPQKVSPSVFMASQNQFVYAINPITGIKKWESFIGSNIVSSPFMYNNILFVGNSSPILFKIDPNTGARGQSKITFPAGIATTPIGREGFLIITSGTDVKCIDIQPDTLEWSFTAGAAINSSPSIRDTQLVFGCDDGSVYMIDNRKGDLIWKTTSMGSQFRSSPTLDDQNIYIGSNNFNMYCLNRKDGAVKWSYLTGAPVQSSPIVYGGNVIFGSDDSKLYCLENFNGTPRWTTTATDRIRSSPYLYGQTVYVGSYDEGLYAVNVLDGSIKWRFTTKGLIAASPVCYLNQVYIGSYDKFLYALDTSNGKMNWKYAINGLMDCSPSVDDNNANGTGINSSISGASMH